MSWIAGTWSGSCLPSSGESPTPLAWSLALRQMSKGLAFGASCTSSSSTHLLRGVCTSSTSTSSAFTLHEPSTGTVYTLVLTPGQPATLRGTYASAATGEAGRVVLALEEEDDGATHVSGLMLGEAAPAPELHDFWFPTNPITWCASAVVGGPSSGSAGEGGPSSGTLFGAGLFTDSADFASPELYFTLSGSLTAASGAGSSSSSQCYSLRLTKTYELGGADSSVQYEGTLAREATGWVARGAWRNPTHGSYGSFAAHVQGQPQAATATATATGPAPPALVVHHALCSCCSRAIAEGDTRWECRLCASPWLACSDCHVSDAAAAHPHFQHLLPLLSFSSPAAQGATCAELMDSAFQLFGPWPLFYSLQDSAASAASSAATATATVTLMTYQQAGQLVHALARQLQALPLPPRSRLALLSDSTATPLFCLLSLAVVRAGHVLLPMHGLLEAGAVADLFLALQPAAAWAPESCEGRLPEGWRSGARRLQLSIASGEAAGAASAGGGGGGAASPPPPPPLPPPQGPPEQDPVCILFTSGSTGTPKAAAFSQALSLPTEGLASIYPFCRLDFQPYDPVLLLSLLSTLQCGGSRAFARMATLLPDCAALRPTHLGAPPAFWQALHAEAGRAGGAGGPAAGASAVRALLGARLRVATSGGAALCPTVAAFVRQSLGLALVELYGCRECGGIARDGRVYPGVTVLLAPVAELGLWGQAGVPPRGEVCVASPRIVQGYVGGAGEGGEGGEGGAGGRFFTQEGRLFYRTGDVGELLPAEEGGEGGGAEAGAGAAQQQQQQQQQHLRLRLLGRVADHFKTSAGEFIEPSAIERILELCPLITAAVLLPCPVRGALAAACLPSAAGAATSSSAMLAALRRLCVQHHLRPAHIPQALLCDREGGAAWSEANGLLTGTQKKRRSALQERYGPLLEAQAQAEAEAAAAAVAAAAASSTDAAAAAAAAASASAFFTALEALHPGATAAAAASPHLTFAELGGDSLSAALLVRACPGLSFAALFAYPLSHVDATYAEAVAAGGAAAAAAAAAAAVLPRDQSYWEAQADPGEELLQPQLQQLSQQQPPLPPPPAAPPAPRTDILLTGATGFLGPHLLLELLQAFPAPARVLCLVRGTAQASAGARLQAALAASGLQLPAGEAERVEVVEGDVGAPARLGLSPDRHAALALRLRAVVHSAAQVSMTLPYAPLAAVNVGGTRAAAALALAAGASLTFVSTIGAAPGAQAQGGEEEGWLGGSSSSSAGSSAGAFTASVLNARGGYGASKAVAERLLLHLLERRGLDVRCVRPSAVCGHRGSGASNPLDFATLTAAACSAVGGAVPSPAPGSGSSGLRWVPVDFVARAVAAVAAAPEAAFAGGGGEAALDGRVFNLFGGGPAMGTVLAALLPGGEVLPPEAWKARLEGVLEKGGGGGEEEEGRLRALRALAPKLAGMAFESRVGPEGEGGAGQPSVNLQRLLGVQAVAAQGWQLAWPQPVGRAELGRMRAWMVGRGMLPA